VAADAIPKASFAVAPEISPSATTHSASSRASDGNRLSSSGGARGVPAMVRFHSLEATHLALTLLLRGAPCLVATGCVSGPPAHVASPADEPTSARASAKEGAVALAARLRLAKGQLNALAQALESGRRLLTEEHKYPSTLAHDLDAIHVDFDVRQLGGRSLVGFSPEVTSDLVQLLMAVRGINDRKRAIQALLTELETPIQAQLARQSGQTTVELAVVIDKDTSGNAAGFLVRLAQPLVVTAGALALPAQLTFASPHGTGNVVLATYKGGDLAASPAAIYVDPKTFNQVCPSPLGGMATELATQIWSVIDEVRGSSATDAGHAVGGSEPGLLERANKLLQELAAIGG
jgi:hypothetical protein